MELIDKEKVIAEIEDKIQKYTKRGEESDANHDGCGMYWGGVISCLNEIRSFLDTLEVKEVDLDKDYEEELRRKHGLITLSELDEIMKELHRHLDEALPEYDCRKPCTKKEESNEREK